MLVLTLLYTGIVVIGFIPVNSGFEAAEDGVEIMVVSNAVHADLVLPMQHPVIDWRDVFDEKVFPTTSAGATHVTIGWGDKGFFLLTPTWGDLKVTVAAKALLWPSDTCVHVSRTNADFLRAKGKSVQISTDQYRRLVDSIQGSLRFDSNGKTMAVSDFHYNDRDAFFESKGRYHCLNTCNSWVGRKLRDAGVTTPWLSPLPKTVHCYFPDQES